MTTETDPFHGKTRLDGLVARMPTHRDPKPEPTGEELAWAAGLFEGEGSIAISGGRYPRLQLKMTDLEPVERFCEILGGTIYGPYANRTGEKDGYARKPYYVWVSKRYEVRESFEKMRPWLSSYRLRRFDEIYAQGVLE